MKLQEAQAWVKKNCDAETCARLRSRRVALTLSQAIDELKRQNDVLWSQIKMEREEHAKNMEALARRLK